MHPLIRILNECAIRDHLNTPPRPYGNGVHLSEINCFRMYYFKRHPELFPKPIPTPETIRNFKSGTMHHEDIQETLVRNKFVDPNDIEYALSSLKVELKSNTDIRKIKWENKLRLVDIKTIQSDPVRELKCPHCKEKFTPKPKENSFEGIKHAKKDHIQQVTLYTYYNNEEAKLKGEELIYDMAILYVRKDGGRWQKDVIPVDWYNEYPNLFQEYGCLQFEDQHRGEDFKVFDIKYDELGARIYAKKVEELYKWILLDEMPPIPDDVDKFTCKNFCSYGRICSTL
jgi:hypothetical protein